MKGKYETTYAYDDIIHLPHPQSVRHPHMPTADRAAQFSPFAALTGYGQLVRDMADAKLLTERVELTEDKKAELDEKLQRFKGHLGERQQISLLYFEENKRFGGGSYVSYRGTLQKMQEHPPMLIFQDGKQVFIRDILELE